jgi:hypothetical protein
MHRCNAAGDAFKDKQTVDAEFEEHVGWSLNERGKCSNASTALGQRWDVSQLFIPLPRRRFILSR